MLKKYLWLLLWLPMAASVWADELAEDCEAAVDAADRLGAPPDKHCDYSKTGLNGVLHQALANKDSATKEAKAAATEKGRSVQSRSLGREFDSAQQLTSVRFEMLQLAAKDCAAGFTLDTERYLPAAEKRLRLELHYHCH
ncbi:MAG TPA: hypothetical protein VN030_07120 [Cellvibrio sp.]|nr:hypothetical protein [Cellvibrio sp.]